MPLSTLSEHRRLSSRAGITFSNSQVQAIVAKLDTSRFLAETQPFQLSYFSQEELQRVLALREYCKDIHGRKLCPITIDRIMRYTCFRGRSNVQGESDRRNWDSDTLLEYLLEAKTTFTQKIVMRVRCECNKEFFKSEAKNAYARWLRASDDSLWAKLRKRTMTFVCSWLIFLIQTRYLSQCPLNKNASMEGSLTVTMSSN